MWHIHHTNLKCFSFTRSNKWYRLLAWQYCFIWPEYNPKSFRLINVDINTFILTSLFCPLNFMDFVLDFIVKTIFKTVFFSNGTFFWLCKRWMKKSFIKLYEELNILWLWLNDYIGIKNCKKQYFLYWLLKKMWKNVITPR